MVNLCCQKQQYLLRILLHLTVMEHGYLTVPLPNGRGSDFMRIC
jgi:hypothetical protein